MHKLEKVKVEFRLKMKLSIPLISQRLRRKLTSTKNSTKRKQQKRHRRTPSHSLGKSSSTVPQWFLENCVKTAEELADCEIPLIIRENVLHDCEATQESLSSKTDTYEVDLAVYEPLLDILIDPRLAGDVDDRSRRQGDTGCFLNDAVHLCLPDKHQVKGGIQFFTTVVERFARDAKADLIIIDVDTFEDLAEQLTGYQLELDEEALDGSYVVDILAEEDGRSLEDYEDTFTESNQV